MEFGQYPAYCRGKQGMRAWTFLKTIFPVLLLSAFFLALPASGYWSQWRGGPTHLAEENGSPTEINELIWKYQTNGQIYSSPSFFEGGMLIGSDDWNIYCFDPDTGVVRWKYKTGGEVQATAFIEDGKAYFGSFDGFLYCLELPEEIEGRPTLSWKLELRGDVISSCHPYEDSIITADTGGFVHRISKDGDPIWSVKHSEDDIWATPIVDAENRRGMIGNISDTLVVFSLDDGKKIDEYSYGEGAELYTSGLLRNNIVYLTDGEGQRLIAEDLTGGDRGWIFEIGYAAYSTPVIEGDRIFLGSFEFAWCLPLEDPDGSGFIEEEEVIWSTPTHDFQGGSSPLIAGNLMFIGSDDYNLYCLDKNTGDLEWTFPTEGYVYSSPALYNGSVYFGSNDRSVYCVGERPPGIELELTLDPLEITADDTAQLWINVTDGDGRLVQNATLWIDTSAGEVGLSPEEIVATPIVAGSGWINLDVYPIDVSSRSTLDITVTAEKEGLTTGTASAQLIVEPGEGIEEDAPEVVDREKERRPYFIGVGIVTILNISLFSVLVLFKVRDYNTEREGGN